MPGCSALAFALLLTTPLDESEVRTHPEQAGFVEMLKLLRLPAVWVFVLCAWLYVMIEQSFGTWLPTFHERVFGLSPALAAGLLSLYAGSIALSRFFMGYLSRHFPWLPVQLTLLAGGFLLTPSVLLLTAGRQGGATVESWSEAPALALVFSCMGFFIGPIYPTIVSIVLGRLEKARHPAMTGLIIVFSALGGTTGSFVVGFISRSFNTHDAFFYPLLPMTLLGLLLVPYRRLTARPGGQLAEPIRVPVERHAAQAPRAGGHGRRPADHGQGHRAPAVRAPGRRRDHVRRRRDLPSLELAAGAGPGQGVRERALALDPAALAREPGASHLASDPRGVLGRPHAAHRRRGAGAHPGGHARPAAPALASTFPPRTRRRWPTSSRSPVSGPS